MFSASIQKPHSTTHCGVIARLRPAKPWRSKLPYWPTKKHIRSCVVVESSISELFRNERAPVIAVHLGRHRMFVVFMESSVHPFSLPFLNSTFFLAFFPMLESPSSCILWETLHSSNLLLFQYQLGLFWLIFFINCSFSVFFELISSYMFSEGCNLRCFSHRYVRHFYLFLVFKIDLDCMLCHLCLTASVFTIIEPIG